MVKVVANHEADWGKIMVQGSQQSFKDEWLAALFNIPLNWHHVASHIELPKLQTEELMTVTLSLWGSVA